MKKQITLVIVLILSLNLFIGCVDNNESTQDNDVDAGKQYTINTNYPRDRLGLNEDGELAFSSAIKTYGEFRDNMSAEDARIALVNELNDGFKNIKEASLSDDGYTIGIVFDDDTAALLVTYNGYFDNNTDVTTSSQFKKDEDTYPDLVFSSKMLEKSDEPDLPVTGVKAERSDGCECVDLIVPQNRKVYYFQADRRSDGRASNSAYNTNFDYFEQYGWTKNDFIRKYREEDMDYGLTPDDLLNLSGFGIVIYTGLSGYCDSYPGAIPGHHYIQCCAGFRLSDSEYVIESHPWAKALGEERYKQYITWRDQGRLIYTGFEKWDGSWIYEFSMDIELFEDEGKIDPGTMVFFSASNSWRLKDAFIDNGAGCFIGWDGNANIYDGLTPLEDMLYTMIKSDTPQHISYAYSQLASVLKKSEYGGTLRIDDNDLDFYLPSFGTMKINFDDPPSGTTHYWLTIHPYGSTKRIDSSFDWTQENACYNGDEIEYDGVCPVDSYITFTAKDMYRVPLESSLVFPELVIGENPDETYTEWNTYGIILEADPISVKDDGIETSSITATLRTWLESDVLEPTGLPIPCKEVEFITNHGFFTSEEKVITDSKGVATIEIASNEKGTATIRAIVEEDAVESYKNVQVTFGEVPYSFRLMSWESEDVYDSGFGEPRTIYEYHWRYWLAFDSIEGAEYYDINLKINGQEYVFGGFSEDQEFITDGKLQSYWTNVPASWNDDYDNGTRFFELGGVTHSAEDDGTYAGISEKQNNLLAFLEGCTFEIKPYTD